MRRADLPLCVVCVYALTSALFITALSAENRQQTVADGDRARDAAQQLALGRDYDRQSRFADALAAYQRALDGYRAAGLKTDEALVLGRIAQVHKNTGDYAGGVAAAQESIALYTSAGDDGGAAAVWVTLGAIHDSIGEHRQALESFQRALPVFERERTHALANLLNEIGITQKNLGRYADARETYRRGLALSREIHDDNMIGFFLLNIGVLYGELGDEEQSIEASRQALSAFRSVGYRRGEAIVLQNLSSSYWMLGNQARALEMMREALAAVRAMGTRNLEGVVLKDLGDMYADMGRTGDAREQYEAALRIQREIGERKSIGSTLVSLAELEARTGRPARAAPLAEEGLAIAKETERPELEWTAHRAIASTAEAAGNASRAIDELILAARIVNDLRANVSGDMTRIAFVDTRQEVFSRLSTLLFSNGRAEAALEASEAGRARALGDLLAQRVIVGKPRDRDALAAVRRAADAPETRGGEALTAELHTLEADHGELATLLTARSATLSEIRATTARLRATLVEYLVTESRVLVWVVTADGAAHGQVIDVSRRDVEALVARVRGGIETSLAAGRATSASLASALRDGDRLLIAPIAEWLPASPDAPVIIVPHGALMLLPFAAVEDPLGRPLLDRHVLVFAPSASVFAYTHTKSTPAAGHRALIVADPTPPHDSGLERLPWSRREARMVAARLPAGTARVLVGDAATEATVKREPGRYAILHFATHGLVVPDRPLASSLLLRDGEGEDGYLRVDEVFGLDLAANLVVLSGCSTGLGKLTGDGIVGLTRAFLYAGTPTVVVSQWNVSDRATSLLMDRFYAELQRGASKAAALRRASLAVRRSLPNPALWAAFQLVGEP